MHRQIFARLLSLAAFAWTTSLPSSGPLSADELAPLTYRRFTVEETEGRIVGTQPVPDQQPPLWARDVSQETADWSGGPDPHVPLFAEPIPFVIPPADAGEPFHPHNHQPSIAWLPNGDLLAIWYSTERESGTELTVLASRLRAGGNAWDPSSEFFKAPNRNMHGSSLFHDGNGTVSHFNGMGPDGGTGWAKLALLMRTSRDNGVTWTPPQAIGPEVKGRHQVISGTLLTSDGVLFQNCDAVPGPHGGTALHVSRDGGKTWTDPGAGKPAPEFTQDGTGEGTIAGIHAKVVELKDGRLMALGRGDSIDERMPMSLSDDQGRTWTYRASPFPPIGGGQRLVLRRLEEGPLLFVSFTSGNRREPETSGMTFRDQEGNEFTGHGMYAALSFDEGETWPVRKLLTPGEGEFDGGAHTGPFTATPTRAEHAGYLAATQTPDRVIHLISSRLHYRFNLNWLTAGTDFAQRPLEGDLNSFLGEPQFEMQQVFKNERFPNVVVALDGTVLATWGNKSLRVRRSEDGGATWGEEITIADPGFQGGGTTVDETTGDVLAFVEEKHPPAPLTIYRSRDQGRTWQPQEKTVIHPDSRGHLPSMHMNEHGITLRHGPQQGRLLRPTRFYAGGNRRDEWPNHYTNAMYSDDGGTTWQTSEPFPENGTGEATLAELSDGRIYYNSRVHWDERPDNTRRRAAWSDDGGQTWTGWHVVNVLPDGHQHRSYGCMGGLTRLPVAATGGLLGAAAPPPVARGSESSSPTPQGAGRDILIFSNIDTPNPTRERATVWASFDGGKTWPVKRLVYEGRSAYSSLNAGRPGTPSEGWIYLFFEGGPEGGGTMARFNLSWLLDGEATGDGELPEF
jgi:sialidase-1